MAKISNAPEVYTLLVQVGRGPDDGLPADASGAALLCYASGRDEAEAVRETANVLKTADLVPLDITSYGTLAEREADGFEIGEEDRALMDRALTDNSVIVAESTVLREEDA